MSEEKQEIEFIYKQNLRRKDFADFDEDSVAALAVLSFAVSELNFILRQYLFVQHSFEGSDEIQLINHFQRNVVLRTFSAKLFEAAEFVQLRGQYNRSRSEELKGLLQRYQRSFRWLEKHPGYPIVKSLRHEVTNHYRLKPARANLRGLPNEADFSFLFHEMQGNCFYQMGETVMHYGRVLRIADEAVNRPGQPTHSEYELWMHWNLSALRWLRRVHRHVADNLIASGLPGRKARKLMLWLPEGASASPISRLIPYFVRK